MPEHKKYMVEQTRPGQGSAQLPNSIVHRGQLAGPRQPSVWYSSNPFMAIIQGTVIGLLENSVPILLIPVVAVALSVLSGVVPLIFIPFVSTDTNTSAFITIWLGLVALIVISSISLHLQLMIASFHQERISVREASDRALERPFGYFCIVVFCTLLPITSLLLLMRSSIISQIVLGATLMVVSYAIIARFWLAAYFFYDNNEGVLASLTASWKLTRMRTFEMLGVITAQIPLCILGVLSPLLLSSGFTTRYFQLKYLHSHGLENTIKTKWINYFLAICLILGTYYVASWRILRIMDGRRQMCYLVTPGDYENKVCMAKKDCHRDPICKSREESRDPTIIIY